MWHIGKRAAIAIFFILDRLGVHMLPKHYYSSIPDYEWLRHNRHLWAQRLSMAGFTWDLNAQISWLSGICAAHLTEVRGLAFYDELVADRIGLGYGPIEAQVTYCFVRRTQPERIVEVGSGISTAVMASAGNRNTRRPIMTCVDPYASTDLRRVDGLSVVRESCQAISLDIFDALNAGDLLFIDSTHAVKVGSDVIRIYLEILPRLKAGVYVHVHDIFLPYPYPRDALTHFFGWQETAFVAAALQGNDHLRVLCCQSALHYDRTKELQTILPDYRHEDPENGGLGGRAVGHFPTSLWLITQ